MKTVILITLFIFAALVQGTTIRVPQDHPTIQQGIDAAQNGDLVLVDEGEYKEIISFAGKKITVASLYYQDQDTTHIQKTIISAPENIDAANGSIVSFVDGETNESVLMGFTITGGVGTDLGEGQRGGGGILIKNASPKILHNVITKNNLENVGNGYTMGGGICVTMSDHVEFTILEENTVFSNSITASAASAYGGGIFAGAHVRILNNYIAENSVAYTGSAVAIATAGGLCCKRESTDPFIDVVIIGNIIENNFVECSKAAFCGGVDLMITRTHFSKNTVRGNVISSSNRQNIPGMRIIGRTDSLLVEDNVFADNRPNTSAQSGGGALEVIYPTNGAIRNNVFERNEAGECAGLELTQTQNIEISGNKFIENEAGVHAGALNLLQSTGTVVYNNIFRDNVSQDSGGACGIVESDGLFYNNILVGNMAVYGGGFYVISNSDVHLINNSLSDNSARDGGATVFAGNNAHVKMLNMICWNVEADEEITLFDATSSALVSHSDIRGGYEGTININLEPQFLDDSLKLANTSPCIDAGAMACELDGITIKCPETDICGNCRTDANGSAPDMGAHEYIITKVADDGQGDFLYGFELYQNFPNPFNPATTFYYDVPREEYVTLAVYDLLGRHVSTLVDEYQHTGRYAIHWNVESEEERVIPAGVYFCRLRAGNDTKIIKLLLVK